MASISKTSYGQKWLQNFDLPDRVVASILLDRLMLVGASEFTSAMTMMLSQFSQQASEERHIVAFYAEREINKDNYDVKSFFPDSEEGRAVGAGIQPVEVDLGKQDVGSEGILAALISKFCKSHPTISVSHPGPDTLREDRIRKIVIVTDFVGSGRRVSEMLDAFAKVATIQSWVSYQLISFHVVCYSATEIGLSTLEHHSLRPKVVSHIACPVIDEAFEGSVLGGVKLLCKEYPKKSRWPFGFGNTGSLIVFSHGIPNNAPQILHSSAQGWIPLFKGRSTLAANIDMIADSSDWLVKNSERILGIRDARHLLKDSEGELWIHTMLILDAVSRGLRTAAKLSARTQIALLRVEEILNLAAKAGWLTDKKSLSVLGRRELKWLKWQDLPDETLAYPQGELYFPTQLRAP